MRVWGMVLEVTPKGIQVSLPHGLRGSVAPGEVRGAVCACASGGSESNCVKQDDRDEPSKVLCVSLMLRIGQHPHHYPTLHLAS